MSDSKFQQRIDRLRCLTPATNHSAILIMNMRHIRYLVGFSGSDGALLISDRNVFLFVDGRYATQARYETNIEIVEYQDKMKGIANTIIREGFRKIGFDAAAISYEHFAILECQLHGVELNPVTEAIHALRSVKDDDEILWIRKAAEIASAAYSSMLTSAKPGVQERDLALELEYQMRTGGAEAVAFDIILASGPNSALPHARPGRRKLMVGDFVVVDYGATYMGYHSDETCTFALGDIDKNQMLVYSIVKTAHDRGLEQIRAGVPSREIDRVVRAYIEEEGFGAYFGHATGHGVGLDVHEPPKIARTSNMVLETGMVITVEPGIYLPEKWGVRIEDLVLVKEDGYELLSKIPKHLDVVNVAA